MKKTLLIISLVLLLNTSLVFAHEHIFTETKQLIDSGISCDKLTGEQLESIGEYYMEQMHPGEQHEIMDKMMGGEGSKSLKQMHVSMAKKLYCSEGIGGIMGSNGVVEMMPMMMGMMGSGMMGRQNPMQTNRAQGVVGSDMMQSMAGNNPLGSGMAFLNYGFGGISNILFIVPLVGLIALIFLGVFKLWKDVNRKGCKKMDLEDFAYVVETSKSLDEAVVSVLKAVGKKGWALFQIYDVKERLAAKGFEQKPLKIIEICSGKYANKFLNKNRLISLCLPCKINVLEENGKVKIVGMKPTMLSQFFPEVKEEEAKEAEKEIIEIVDNSR